MHPTIDYTKMQQNVIGITSKSDLKNDNPINGAKSTNCDFEENKQPLQSLSALFNDEKVRVAETTIKSSYTHSFDELMHKLHAHKQELDNQIGVLRQSQAALEESRTRYVELFEFAPVGYVSLNAEGMIVKINLNGANLLGVEGNNLISRCLAEFIADEYQDQWHQLCLQAKQTRRKQIYEMPIRQNDGTLFHAHFDCLYQEANNASSALHIIFTDITERKKTEEELRIAAVTFEMQEGIIITDTHKVIMRVNHAFSCITGYSAEDAISKTPSFLRSGLHDSAFYQSLWATVARDGFWQGEIWNKHKNGELFPIWQTITAVRREDNTISHYVLAFTDIRVEKQAEKILLDTRDNLETQVVSTKHELEKVKQETAEINTALNVILKHRELDKTDAQFALSYEVEATILPLLKQLFTVSKGRYQTSRLIGILEANLQQLMKSYGRAANLGTAYQKLTPVETQVASMVRQGLPSKVIAAALNISSGTVSIHRKHIRKKFGLDGKADNLHSYLLSLTE